jgi:hypothetical protein
MFVVINVFLFTVKPAVTSSIPHLYIPPHRVGVIKHFNFWAQKSANVIDFSSFGFLLLCVCVWILIWAYGCKKCLLVLLE